MTWAKNAVSAESWRDNPGQTALQAGACLVTFPLCLGYEIARISSELGRAAENTADNARESLANAVDGATERAGGFFDTFGRAAARPLDSASELAKWVSIGIFAIVALVLIAAFVFFFARG